MIGRTTKTSIDQLIEGKQVHLNILSVPYLPCLYIRESASSEVLEFDVICLVLRRGGRDQRV